MSITTMEVPTKTGTIKWFNAAKGYGFIIPDDGRADVFLHAEVCHYSRLGFPKEGIKVAFMERQTDKGRTASYVQETSA